MQEDIEQKQTFWGWREISGLGCFLVAVSSLSLGLLLNLTNPSSVFHINELQQQSEVLDKIKEHIAIASTSYDVNIAEQQLTKAVDQIDQYIKAQPTVDFSGDDFKKWHRGILGVRGQLQGAKHVVNSNPSLLEKLEAQKIALDSLKDFAQIKQTNYFGGDLGVEYNVPSSIPFKLNSLEATIADSSWVLFLVTVASVLLLVIVIPTSADDSD